MTNNFNASFYRVATIDTTNSSVRFIGQLTDYYINGNVLMKGNYNALGQKDGEFSWYYDNGQIHSIGPFIDDKLSGRWVYNLYNGQLFQVIEFRDGLFDVKEYYSTSGKPILKNGTGLWEKDIYEGSVYKVLTGKLKNGKRDGKWVLRYFNTGGVIATEVYEEGKLVKSIGSEGTSDELLSRFDNSLFYPETFKITEKFAIASGVYREDYPYLKSLRRKLHSQDNKVYTVVEQSPVYPGGIESLYQLISKSIHYPNDARRNGITGTVTIRFVVDENGVAGNFEVFKGIGGGCDDEAIRVLALMDQWIPGYIDGLPVKVEMLMPVKFNIAGQ